MANWKNLYDVMKEDEEFYKRYVKFVPNAFGGICIPSEESGCDYDQMLLRDYDVTFHPFIFKDNLYLVGSPTTELLTLRGQKGYDGAIKCMSIMASLYEKSESSTMASAMSLEMFEALPEYLQKVGGRYWLASRHINDTQVASYYGVYKVYGGKASYSYLSSSLSSFAELKSGIRPVILMPRNTLALIGNSLYDGEISDQAIRLRIPRMNLVKSS